MGWKLDFIERLYALLHSGGLKMFRKAEILFFKVLYCVPLVVAAITPILLPLLIAGVIIFWFPMVGKAEMQPFYNFEVTIDRAEDDQFNEKIEVYVEKGGQYFDDYDLNRSNSYCYRREMKTGEYRLYARVRYDQSGDYQVEPEYLDLKIGGTDYREMHRTVFFIHGGEVQDEDDHETVAMDGTDTTLNGEVYTIERMDELKQMQTEIERQVQNAFQANEQWEREHNFLAQHQVSDPNVADWKDTAGLSQHYYPDQEDMSEGSREESVLQESEATLEETGDRETLNSTMEPTTEANKEEVEEQTPMKNGIWWAVGAIIFIFAGVGFYLRQRGENIE